MAEPVSLARNVAEGLVSWAREETERMGERGTETVSAILRELGFVTQHEYQELELRVAQLEHRLRLLESATPPVTLDSGGATGDTEPQPAL
jgi:polyhydroxyalkanoate synthesis regulator phasin